MQKTTIRSRAIILNEDKMFIVKHSPDFPHYALPGGKAEEGESPLVCIKREIQEETGIVLKEDPVLVYVANWFNEKKNENNLEFIFLIEDGKDFLNLDNFQSTHAFELVETQWMSREEEFNLLPLSIKKDFMENKIEKDKVKFV
jgi:8-oxo-dGTP pyrophosphatase MutT (NUDIX family)